MFIGGQIAASYTKLTAERMLEVGEKLVGDIP